MHPPMCNQSLGCILALNSTAVFSLFSFSLFVFVRPPAPGFLFCLRRPYNQNPKKLLDLVGQCAQHPQSEDHRELAFVILFELTETVGDVLTAHFDVLQGLFLQALKDPR